MQCTVVNLSGTVETMGPRNGRTGAPATSDAVIALANNVEEAVGISFALNKAWLLARWLKITEAPRSLLSCPLRACTDPGIPYSHAFLCRQRWHHFYEASSQKHNPLYCKENQWRGPKFNQAVLLGRPSSKNSNQLSSYKQPHCTTFQLCPRAGLRSPAMQQKGARPLPR